MSGETFRAEHLRAEIRRCNRVIDSGKADAWWYEDRSRFEQELRAIEQGTAALTQPPETTPGASWSSPSLGRAYAEVESVRDALSQPPESGIDEALRRAMEAIEAADCELMGVAI